MIKQLVTKILDDPSELLKLIGELFILIMIANLRHQNKKDELPLDEDQINTLIQEFTPANLIENVPDVHILPHIYNVNHFDLASYDAYGISRLFRKRLKRVIKRYGIGTCGPSNFYGRLDLHIELEAEISKLYKTAAALLYSNSFTCICSVISCFCGTGDRIFYYKNSNEAIVRGIYLSKSMSFEFKDLNALNGLLELFINPKARNFVIIEGLCKNTGEILDLPGLMNLKKKYPFRIILDESSSLPLLGSKGIFSIYNIRPINIDIIIGSFSFGFSSNGGFVTASKEIINYQRLSSSSYVFSASLPGVITKFNTLAMKKKYKADKLREKIKVFHQHFSCNKFEIISDLVSPIIVISRIDKNNVSKTSVLAKELFCVKNLLLKNKIYVGINMNPLPSLRIVIKVAIDNRDLIEISKTIGSVINNSSD